VKSMTTQAVPRSPWTSATTVYHAQLMMCCIIATLAARYKATLI